MARANLQTANGMRTTVEIGDGEPPKKYAKDGRVYDLKQRHVSSGRDPIVATYVENIPARVVRTAKR
jgi:hypothetical protein